MSKSLPANASFEQLKKQAKDVLHAHGRKDASACAVLRNLNRFKEAADVAILDAEVGLHDAQFALAMEYGFKSWADLKARVEGPGGDSILGETPEHPELDYVRQQVQTVLTAHGRGDQRVLPVLRGLDQFKTASDAYIFGAGIGLNEAQSAVAVAYGFKSWIDLRAYTEEWRNAPVNVPGPIKSVADILALPDGAVQFILRHVYDEKLAVLIGRETPSVVSRISACIPAGRLKHCRRWIAEHGGKASVDDARRSVVDTANDVHSQRFRGFSVTGDGGKGVLPRVSAMSRDDVIRWGRETFTRIAGTAPASRRTMAELVTMFKGFLALWQFPLAMEAVAHEFADEPLAHLGLLTAADGVDMETARAALDTERTAALERFGRRQDAVLASDCGFTRHAELKERLEAAAGDGPFRTVDDVAALADGGLELVVGFLRGSTTAGLLGMDQPGVRERFSGGLPRWWRDSMADWLDEMPGADRDQTSRNTVKTANALHAAGVLVRPGETPSGDVAPLTLKSHSELAGWARAEFIRIAGDKRASERDLDSLDAMFHGFAAIGLFPLAAETTAGEFADEELVRMAATQFMTTRPGGGVRHTMELKAKSLDARYRRRLDLIAEACWSMICAESDEMLVARCEAFL